MCLKHISFIVNLLALQSLQFNLPSPHGRQLRKLLRFPFLNFSAASFPTPLYPIGSQEAARISSVGCASHLASSSLIQQQVASFVLSALPTPWMSEFIPSGNADFEFLPDFDR